MYAVCHKYVRKKRREQQQHREIRYMKRNRYCDVPKPFMIFLIMRLKQQRPGTEFKHKRKRTLTAASTTHSKFLPVCWSQFFLFVRFFFFFFFGSPGLVLELLFVCFFFRRSLFFCSFTVQQYFVVLTLSKPTGSCVLCWIITRNIMRTRAPSE